MLHQLRVLLPNRIVALLVLARDVLAVLDPRIDLDLLRALPACLSPHQPPSAPPINGNSRASMPATVMMVPKVCLGTSAGSLGNVTPLKLSMRLVPSNAPTPARTKITSSASAATSKPCLAPARLAIRPAQ